MSAQASPYLRRVSGGYEHWCPACDELHRLPDEWQFDGDLLCPTFAPSFRHWFMDDEVVCHYVVWRGILQFGADCTHELAGEVVPMPHLPRDTTCRQS